MLPMHRPMHRLHAPTQYATPAPTAHQLGNQASTNMGYGHQGMKEAFTNMAGAFRGAGRRGGGHGHGRRVVDEATSTPHLETGS